MTQASFPAIRMRRGRSTPWLRAMLADQLAPVKSPFRESTYKNREDKSANIDMIIGQETMAGILEESVDQVESLTRVLRF